MPNRITYRSHQNASGDAAGRVPAGGNLHGDAVLPLFLRFQVPPAHLRGGEISRSVSRPRFHSGLLINVAAVRDLLLTVRPITSKGFSVDDQKEPE
jgi:hypothetical protein